MKILRSDVSGASGYPDLELETLVLPRGVVALGTETIAPLFTPPVQVRVSALNDSNSVPDFMRDSGIIVVSTRLREVFDRFRADIEYVSAILSHAGRVFDAYWIANPRQCLRGIDLSRSIVELDDFGLALAVDKMVLNPEAFRGNSVAILEETLDIAVQDCVADAIIASGATGCAIDRPEFVTL